MPFMVIYSTSDGSSCHEQADAIDEAALLVERLRNQEGIEDTRIYRMEEISFAFRPYYKVELGMPERLSTAPPSEVVGTSSRDTAGPEATGVPSRRARCRRRPRGALGRDRGRSRPAAPSSNDPADRQRRRRQRPARPVRPLSSSHCRLSPRLEPRLVR